MNWTLNTLLKLRLNFVCKGFIKNAIFNKISLDMKSYFYYKSYLIKSIPINLNTDSRNKIKIKESIW